MVAGYAVGLAHFPLALASICQACLLGMLSIFLPRAFILGHGNHPLTHRKATSVLGRVNTPEISPSYNRQGLGK